MFFTFITTCKNMHKNIEPHLAQSHVKNKNLPFVKTEDRNGLNVNM